MIEDPTLHVSPETESNRQESQPEEIHESTSWGLKIALALFAVFAGFAGAYGWLQHNAAQQLVSERAGLNATLAQAHARTDELTAKVNDLSAAQAQEAAARAQAEAAKNQQLRSRTAEGAQHSTHHVAARRVPVDDPRWKQVQQQLGDEQNQLSENKQQLEQTQADLQQAKSELGESIDSARTDLGGSIARTHDELVALEKKGERNYYEFNFPRSKDFHHAGPISLAVVKANPKHEYCDLQMIVNDSEISRKHVDLYESISLYPAGYPMPLEVVINRIGKDFVQGYVSEPKLRAPEKATAATSANSAAPPSTTASVNAVAPSASDVKLERREDAH